MSNDMLLARIERIARDALQIKEDRPIVDVLDEIAQLAAKRKLNKRSARIVDRNAAMLVDRSQGLSYSQLSQKYHVTRARCGQICRLAKVMP